MTIRHMPVAALTAAALSLIVINSPAFAQGAVEPQATQPVQETAPAAISDQKIEAFAVAYLQVDKVRQDYAAKIGAEKDATNKQKLQNEANQQMINAVEKSPDMSLDEYKTIITAAQTNPDVAKKVQEKLKVSAPAQ
ncbi:MULTISPECIES: DUF4168 domain-containing protein [unclassified Rhizobium]|uniref:DUF4168 domain-containing protein n=1 Tax=unclassified Rhizobium TaxID=2613769 RepID=UPI00071312ED|nr:MULTISPECIES: DUF4168 domain-containing protein [unclassified Rhizobium]KQS99141.1 hypothetical protein ASG50_20790 [Rhizobium sp. Leaf386]KQT05384.1 hypothetical protein ASG42_20915 [Rhizobium sp. Leaf391]KQT91826.1 hypothetical protein ASG68_18565 [Rhizobium sp. Leaf453]